ncbi:MAG: hypothetical protein ABJE95_27580 [Byssovorax sp.]
MNHSSYGAVVHGHRPDAASTVEARTLDGARVVALIAVQGDLATPSLESVKGELARLARATDVARLMKAAPPPPYASGVAVVVLAGDQAHVASAGGARCYRERDGVLHELAAGTHELRSGDALIASSHESLAVDRRFFASAVEPPASDEFHNDTLDAALDAALQGYASSVFALAAARIG